VNFTVGLFLKTRFALTFFPLYASKQQWRSSGGIMHAVVNERFVVGVLSNETWRTREEVRTLLGVCVAMRQAIGVALDLLRSHGLVESRRRPGSASVMVYQYRLTPAGEEYKKQMRPPRKSTVLGSPA
jgi:hypothetical protein